MSAKVRLYVDHPLTEGQTVPLGRDAANYLFAVMRLPVGAHLTLINGRDGAWEAEVLTASKRSGTLMCHRQSAPFSPAPDLWLLFAPVKKANTDFIVQKAVELGVAHLVPVATDFTNADRIRQDRLQAQAVEAAEQCGATHVPTVTDLQKLSVLLDDWPEARRLMFCDETAQGRVSVPAELAAPAAILIGPEGGFSDAERARLHGMDCATPVSLGPRILRAETAAVVALTLWQATHGDWR